MGIVSDLISLSLEDTPEPDGELAPSADNCVLNSTAFREVSAATNLPIPTLLLL